METFTQAEKELILIALDHLFTAKGVDGGFENHKRVVILADGIIHKLNPPQDAQPPPAGQPQSE